MGRVRGVGTWHGARGEMHVSVVGRGGVMRVGPCSVWIRGRVRGMVRGCVARGGSGGPGGGGREGTWVGYVAWVRGMVHVGRCM